MACFLFSNVRNKLCFIPWWLCMMFLPSLLGIALGIQHYSVQPAGPQCTGAHWLHAACTPHRIKNGLQPAGPPGVVDERGRLKTDAWDLLRMISLGG